MLRSRWIVGLLIAALVALGASPSPTPTPAPVIELHRTAAASRWEPHKANPLFILVIGSDVREGDPAGGRADSLHIVAVNAVTGRGTVVGVPRDSYVPIAGRGTSKINDALVYGGASSVVATVTAATGIPIHYWALTDFSRFVAMTNKLGGVSVDVPYAHDDALSGARFSAGRHHMDGPSLLALARNRHGPPGGDFGRSENQGRILLAALAKFRTEAAEPMGMLKYLEVFREFVVSDVPVSDLIKLGTVARRLDPNAFANVIVPSRTGQVGSASVVFWEPGAAALFRTVTDDGML